MRDVFIWFGKVAEFRRALKVAVSAGVSVIDVLLRGRGEQGDN